MADKPKTTGATGTTAAPRKPAKTKRERFLAVANGRVPRTCNVIDALARCGNKRQYEYTPEERTKLLSLVRAAFGRLEAAFSDAPASNGALFG